MNLIPMIREALGLEIEGEFQLLKSDGTLYNNLKYRFADDNELQYFASDIDCWKSSRWATLENIVYGKVTVKKLFKPKDSEFYYYVSLYTARVIRDRYTENNGANRVQVKSGNCYRTQEEAENHVDEWMTKVYGKDWKELLK